MSQPTVTDPSSSNSILVVIALAVVAALAWVVWIVRQNQPEPESAPSTALVSAPEVPAKPAIESNADRCTRLWKAGSTSELLDALREWLKTPTANEVSAWLHQLPANAEREKLFITIAPDVPIPARLDLALAIEAKKPHRELIVETLETWAATNATAALAWADQHAADSAFPLARTALLTAWAAEHPRDAAAYIDAQGDAAQQTKTINAVLRRWMESDPSAAGAWIELLPNESQRFAAATTLVHAWTAFNADAASDWVEQLPPSPLRDTSLNTLARSLAESSPDDARPWAEQISNATMREACLKAIASSER